MLFLNYLIYIFISSFIIFFILAFVQAKKQKLKIKENKALFFDKIKKNKPILKISDDVYYYNAWENDMHNIPLLSLIYNLIKLIFLS